MCVVCLCGLCLVCVLLRGCVRAVCLCCVLAAVFGVVSLFFVCCVCLAAAFPFVVACELFVALFFIMIRWCVCFAGRSCSVLGVCCVVCVCYCVMCVIVCCL